VVAEKGFALPTPLSAFSVFLFALLTALSTFSMRGAPRHLGGTPKQRGGVENERGGVPKNLGGTMHPHRSTM